MKQIILAVLGTAIIVGAGVWFFVTNQEVSNEPKEVEAEMVQKVDATNSQVDDDYFNEEELVEFTKSYIGVLQRLYYINQDDSGDADSITGLVVSMLTEAMKDRNNLQNVLYKTEEMQKSNILGASVTGLVVNVSVKQLIDAHNDYIAYLRGVDEMTVELAEFQYQIAQFQSSTKSAYLSMVENTGIFPLTFLKLNNDPDIPGEWRISEASRAEIVNEIDLRFGDIFVADAKKYEGQGMRDTTVYMVQSLRDFFEAN